MGALVALMIVSGAASAKAQVFGATAAARIDAAAEAQIKSGKAVGVAVAVFQDGKPVHLKGYGTANLEWNMPVTADTVFKIASITKSFTAASVLLLVQDGKLKLDDTVSKHVPDFPGGERVTIRQLLTHTSGLNTYDEAVKDQRDLMVPRTTSEMIALIKDLEPLYVTEPGTAYKYSNAGFYLLGHIIETISGRSLGQFMKERLFDPSGMASTAMDDSADIVPLRAAGYVRDINVPGGLKNPRYIPYTTPGPAGGLRSTVSDLAKGYEALFGGKLIKPELFKQMITPGKLADGRPSSAAVKLPPGTPPLTGPIPYEYGFGIRISKLEGHREYWHSGAVDGFTSNLRIYPDDKVTIALAANTFRALDGVLEAVERAALGLPEAPKDK
ncbi:MAG: beta-lactamase family protein [Rhodospirillaceae bacterium]|nr:beta-lactamase family protein [Rhodospirillaceae bacterium]